MAAMPIYEYACRACGHEFEALVRASDQPACASCGSKELQKKLSTPTTQKYTPGETAANKSRG
jgi:putative FmdB family regulatory protein